MCWPFVCRKPCKWLAPVFEVCREQHNEKPHRVCHRRVGNISVVTMTSFQPGIHTWFESGMPYLDKEKCISLVQVWNAVVWLWWSELRRWDFFSPSWILSRSHLLLLVSPMSPTPALTAGENGVYWKSNEQITFHFTLFHLLQLPPFPKSSNYWLATLLFLYKGECVQQLS